MQTVHVYSDILIRLGEMAVLVAGLVTLLTVISEAP